MILGLLTSAPAISSTLLESEDTLYNLNLLGFFHVDLASRLSGNDADGDPPINSGFQEARLIGHFSSRLGPRFSAFMEVEATQKIGDNAIHIERLIGKYDIDNDSQISIGRFHAPVGYWNQHYHHGRWLQTSIDRPLQTEFGGSYLPGHYWGTMYERNIRAGERVIELDIGAGAGRDADLRAPDTLLQSKHGGASGSDSSLHSNWSMMGQISVVPADRLGLMFGGSFWFGDLEGHDIKSKERILTAHINVVGESSAFLSEVAFSQHDRPGRAGSTDNFAAYAEYNFRLDAVSPRLRPYGRLDFMDIDEQDVAYSVLDSRTRVSLGARYDVTDSGALKLEIRQDRFREGGKSSNSLQCQYAVIFW